MYLYSRKATSFTVREVENCLLDTEEHVRAYVPLGFRLLGPRQSAVNTEVAFIVPHLGRFGNAVRDITKAIAVAKILKVGHLYLFGKSIFTSGGELSVPRDRISSSGIEVWLDSEPKIMPVYSRIVLW